VLFEASAKPPLHKLIHEFLINMAFIMAYPNLKEGLKMAFGPLGVKLGMKVCGIWKHYFHLTNYGHFIEF
jgi:hypothetical protein